jgi:hypothetical protein
MPPLRGFLPPYVILPRFPYSKRGWQDCFARAASADESLSASYLIVKFDQAKRVRCRLNRKTLVDSGRERSSFP